MNEPEWLEESQVLMIHEKVINASGGSHGLRDSGLLQSALSRAQNVFAYEEASLFDLAALYAEGIAFNHPFIDGNKRTAMTTADLFLKVNGYELVADQLALADLIVALAEKTASREDVAAFFEKNSTTITIY